jgi:hypothetical protein
MDLLIAAQLVVNRNATFDPPRTGAAEDAYYRRHEGGAWARWLGRLARFNPRAKPQPRLEERCVSSCS